jgi:hypothetical protein
MEKAEDDGKGGDRYAGIGSTPQCSRRKIEWSDFDENNEINDDVNEKARKDDSTVR